MKVLILGVNGMLGFTLLNYLNTKKNINLFGTIRNKKFNTSKFSNKIYKNLNVKNFDLLEKKIKILAPDILINCIGIVKSEVKKSNMKNVITINTKLPNFLNKISNKYKFRFIHISTDCVFSGKKKKIFRKKFSGPC